MNILIIDNYDSFVYNIAQSLGRSNITTHVHRNDTITLNKIKKMNIDAIII
ncbi:MAG: aminodeoxychorismate/anthranilate synthase component II, partial [Nitrososphaeraceae archaeon]|nr:aminodeoxychorismate/anthranilate synthase component II [Nitrososphaeraceae archaeon]